MEEADHVCSKLAILVRGTVREQGTPAYIKGLLGGDIEEVTLEDAFLRFTQEVGD